jgi:hypothetical protein
MKRKHKKSKLKSFLDSLWNNLMNLVQETSVHAESRADWREKR